MLAIARVFLRTLIAIGIASIPCSMAHADPTPLKCHIQPKEQQQNDEQQQLQMPQIQMPQTQLPQQQMQLPQFGQQPQQRQQQKDEKKKPEEEDGDTYSIDLDRKVFSWGGYDFPARITDTLILVNGHSRKNDDHELVEFKGWFDRIDGSMAMQESFELHDNTGKKFNSSHLFLGKCKIVERVL